MELTIQGRTLGLYTDGSIEHFVVGLNFESKIQQTAVFV